MDLPALNGVIDRRMLVNYKVDPDVVQKILPKEFFPVVINGYASAGICLLRLTKIGIKYSPSFLRITSENAAHRFLVKWTSGGKERHGVYIPRRDTDSFLNVWLAGKLFSWPHYRANFEIKESNGGYFLKMLSKDSETEILVSAKAADSFPSDSMFDSIEHASECFKDCSTGYSPSTIPNRFKIIQLIAQTWSVKPLEIRELHSTFFENTSIFPKGTIQFDSALLMENIAHEWRSVGPTGQG